MLIRSIWLIVFFKSTIYLLIFCLLFLSTIEREVLKSDNIVNLSFQFYQLSLKYFEAPLIRCLNI